MAQQDLKTLEQKYGWLLGLIAFISGPVGWAFILIYLIFRSQIKGPIKFNPPQKKHTGIFKHIKAANEQIKHNKPSNDVHNPSDVFANTYLREIVFVLAIFALIGLVAYLFFFK